MIRHVHMNTGSIAKFTLKGNATTNIATYPSFCEVVSRKKRAISHTNPL